MTLNRSIPHEIVLDNSLGLFFEGYLFMPNRFNRFGTDIFQTRLFGEEVICLRGEEAARVFYDNNRFQRKGAAPKRVLKTLFGENGVQGLDGEAHKHRKALFMSLMTPERLKTLVDITRKQWDDYSRKWETMKKIVLFEEAQKILCRAACEWAGVPLYLKEVNLRADDFGAMIDAFGAVGPRHWEGRAARMRSECWMKKIIEQIRLKKLNPPEDTAAYAISWHRDLNGQLLDLQVAAVELINIVRPIVAIATYITFGAAALIQFRDCRMKLQSDTGEYGEGGYMEMFVQEVRRYYPFTPFVSARACSDFEWNGCRFAPGTMVLFDAYGTNHDARLWNKPLEFWPERFAGRKENQFDFVPQGGGDYYEGHRCAGEWITIDLMKASLEFLIKELDYSVPEQDMGFSLSRIPSIPKSRFIMSEVKRKNQPVS